MDSNNYTTKTRKGQHLSRKERYEIQIRLKDQWSIYRIAKELGRSYNTIKNEIKRGSVTLYNGKVQRYKAEKGEEVYLNNRQKSRRKFHCLEASRFLQYVVEHFKGDDKWSLDACYGAALRSGKFRREEMVCTKTLYNYVDLGLLPIKNIDLPAKLSRNTKMKKTRENRKNLGRSIEERPEIVALREEFGHWEIDTVIGMKGEDEPCVLTLVERMTRMCLWIKARKHTVDAITEAIQQVMSYFEEQRNQVFKTITGDNGSEFSGLSLFEDGKLKVYFTHPYSSWEKGSNECHNRMLRRFVPKGKSISDYTADQICFFADCINGLPRKILNYATPEELFELQLDEIYAI